MSSSGCSTLASDKVFCVLFDCMDGFLELVGVGVTFPFEVVVGEFDDDGGVEVVNCLEDVSGFVV